MSTKLFGAEFEYHEAVTDEVEELIRKWRDDVLAARPDMIKAWEQSDIRDETAEVQVIGEVWFEGDEIVRELWVEDDDPARPPAAELRERAICPFCGETIEPGRIDPCSFTFVPGPDPDQTEEAQGWFCHARCLAASFERAGVAQLDPGLWKE